MGGRRSFSAWTYLDHINQIHIGFNREVGSLHLHQFSEYYRQLGHLPEVDQVAFGPVVECSVEKYQVFEVNAA